jgi:zinc and cadmium transporter
MNLTLMAIVAGTLACGVGSVWCAAALSFGPLARFTNHMLSLAAGALLATALLHLMPEVLESHIDAHTAFAVLLAGLIFFFLLDKAQLWHHGHEHEHRHSNGHRHGHGDETKQVHDQIHHHVYAHNHHHHAPKADKPFGAWSILVGDSVHCFGDGILIAAAFMADMRLGILATLAVLTHEIPHHVGDLLVLRPAGFSALDTKIQGVVGANADRNTAVIKVSLAGAVTTVGGIAGYFLLERLQDSVPYFLMLASSSFVYVALADLIPQLQKQLTLKQTLAQVFWLFVGIAAVMVVNSGVHNH